MLVPKKNFEYNLFVRWIATPTVLRDPPTQAEFSAKFGIGHDALANWKKQSNFWKEVKALTDEWGKERTPDVVAGIYRSAVKGNPHSQKLWLQAFAGFNEHQQDQDAQKVEVSPNDIRFLIDALPEPLRSKHYANFRELLDDASVVATNDQFIVEGEIVQDDGHAKAGSDTSRPTPAIPREADHPTQDVSNAKANRMAGRDPFCLCENMVRKAQPHNHQSAARWW